MTTSLVFLVLTLFLPLIIPSQAYTFKTDPSYVTGQDVFITAEDGDDVEISCSVYDNTNTQNTTEWFVTVNGTTDAVSFTNMTGDDDYSYITVNDTYESNLNISFTEDIDRIKLACVAGTTNVTFQIGIESLPVLKNFGTVNATEGNSYSVDFEKSTNDPFPSNVTWEWTFNNQDITDSNIAVNKYQITFNSLNRIHSGIYALTARNDAGTATSNFTLDVQYRPGGTARPASVCALPGSTVTLVAFTNYSSNPAAFYKTWVFNNTPVSESSDARFTEVFSSSIVSFTITNVSTDENGTWVFGAVNTVGQGFTSVDLYVPSAVTNFRNTSFNDSEITLAWSVSSLPVTQYKIEVATGGVGGPSITTSSTTTTLTGLSYNTNYTFTIAALSSCYPNGTDKASITVTTNFAVPKIQSANTSLVNDNIFVSWKLLHIGGQQREQIYMAFYCHDESARRENASGLPEFSINCTGSVSTCFDADLKGSFQIGPVTAGHIYRCVLGAYTRIGYDFREFGIATPSITITSSVLPTATITSTSTTGVTNSTSVYIPPTNAGASANIPVIVGSVVGSVAAIIAVLGVIAFVAFYMYKKKGRSL